MRSSWVTTMAAIPREFISLADELHHLLAEVGVERRRRFVEEHEVGVVHQRPADGDPLALATRERRRAGGRGGSPRPSSSRSWSARLRAGRAGAAPDLVDHEQVLARGEERHEVHGLEDEADVLATEVGELLRRVLGDVLAADDHAALGGRQDAAGDRAQRGLARSGRADERDDLVVADGEGRVVERDHLFVAGGVHLAHRVQCAAPARRAVLHDDLPIAEAGSTRSTRRSEKALPDDRCEHQRGAADDQAAREQLVRDRARRQQVRSSAQREAGADRRRDERDHHGLHTTPPNSVRDRAPIAFNMP